MVSVPVLSAIKFEIIFGGFVSSLIQTFIITHNDKTGDVLAEKILVSRILFKLAG